MDVKASNITLHIKIARNTSYSLMSAGLHGQNGLNHKASIKIISTYITLRLLYGLEATYLSKGEMEELELFYRSLLRNVQGLTDKVAVEATYLLMGCIQLEGQLHIRYLTLFGAIMRMRGHTLHSLAMRQ